jgi:hypothetical protein
MSEGYDAEQNGVVCGKVDSVTYQSRTLGSAHKAFAHMPPGFNKEKNILFYSFFIGLAEMKRNG